MSVAAGRLARHCGMSESGAREADQDRILSAYPELRALARKLMGRERSSHTLQPTALVHEAYMRLMRQDGLRDADRGTILSAAARAMRNILVDHARGKHARKRDAGLARRALDDALKWYDRQPLDLIALDEALQQLQKLDPELATIVELRFFIGLDTEAVAAALGVSTRTVERGWRAARIWLYQALGMERE